MKIAGHEYSPGDIPSPELIRAVRLAAGHTQSEAAVSIWMKPRTWEGREYGRGRMSAAEFELYCRRVGLWPRTRKNQ